MRWHVEMLNADVKCSVVDADVCCVQCVNRPAVCVTVMLLLAAAHSKRTCDYSAIISTYRALILVELQNLVSVI